MYRHDAPGPGWSFAGTLATQWEGRAQPEEVVGSLWNSNAAARELRIGAEPYDCPLRRALLRLAVHAEKYQTEVRLTEHDRWRQALRAWTGGTLGLRANDDIGANWQIYADTSTPVDRYQLEDAPAVRAEAAELTRSMDARTWEEVKRTVGKQISNYGSHELSDAMHETWSRWCTTLDNDTKKRERLMAQLLMAEAERALHVCTDMRIGPRTADLLTDGLMLSLALVVALDPDEGTWETMNGKPMHSIALVRCANLERSAGSSLEVDQQASQLLSREKASVVVLSGTSASPHDLLPQTLDRDSSAQLSLSDLRIPEAVFTASLRVNFRGDLEALRSRLKKQKDCYAEARDRLLQESQAEALVA